MPPSLSTALPAAPAAGTPTNRAGWLLPAGLLFALLLLGRWSQAPAGPGPRGTTAGATGPTHPPRPTLTSTVASTL